MDPYIIHMIKILYDELVVQYLLYYIHSRCFCPILLAQHEYRLAGQDNHGLDYV